MRAAVLGSPVAHSLSPVLHRAAYRELGLAWTYDAYEVGEDALRGFLDRLGPEWAGLSLTMPLKRAVVPMLDWVSPRAKAVAAVNTVVLSEGRRTGANTDVPGMVAALHERGVTEVGTAAVLGGGATATSALAALADLGVRDAVVIARRPDSLHELRAAAQRLEIRPDVRRWADAAAALRRDLVVSTVPGQAAAGLIAVLPERPGVLFDVVYDPWPTTLATAWAAAGGTVVGGLDLLVHQAALQVALMTGQEVSPSRLVPVLRAAGEQALAERAGGG